MIQDAEGPSNSHAGTNSTFSHADAEAAHVGTLDEPLLDVSVRVAEEDVVAEEERKAAQEATKNPSEKELEESEFGIGGGDKKHFTMARLMRQAWPERWLLALATLALFVAAAAGMIIPLFVGGIIDVIADPDQHDDPRDRLNRASLVLLGIITVSSLFTFLRGALFTLAGERVVARLRKELFSCILQQEVSMFDIVRTGQLVNRLASDTAILKNALTVNISMALRWVAQVLASITFLFLVSWQLTLIMLAVVPVVVLGAALYGRYIRKLSKQTQDALAKASEVADESMSNIRTVRSFAREEFQMGQYGVKVDESYALGAKMAVSYGAFIGLIGMVATSSIIVVLWFGARMVLDDELTTGQLTSFILYTLMVAAALGGLSGLFSSFMQAVGANERVFAIIDRQPRIVYTGGRTLDTVKGEVAMQNVSFTYPSRPNTPVLRDVSLRLKPGTVTALVGHSGSGKSTTVGLLMRFYESSHGSVLLDGVDVTTLDPQWLHRNVGLVAQEPVLFAMTIEQNIKYGVHREVTSQEVREAARQANALEFIEAMEEGFETRVGERGVRLSGGQKQRVAIARALLMNPSILLLDEATSALDAHSEHLVQQALDRAMEGRTVLVIAHRLSTVRNADKVVVMDGGRVAEEGTHDELLSLEDGAYARLVAHQLQS